MCVVREDIERERELQIREDLIRLRQRERYLEELRRILQERERLLRLRREERERARIEDQTRDREPL